MALADLNIQKIPKILHKFLIFEEEVLQERWDACNSCEFLTKNYICSKCSCFMRLKSRVKNMKCPIDKWREHGT